LWLLDGPRRRCRGRGDQAGLRRSCLPHPDQRDQVHARALLDGVGRGRAGVFARADGGRVPAPDDQPRRAGPRLRPGLRAPPGPPVRHRDRPVEFVRLRRPQRVRGRGPSPPRSMTTEPEHAIAVENLTKRYGDLWAVNDISFNVTRGEVFAFLGPNGAGKTTTVEIIETIRRATAGGGGLLGKGGTRRRRGV